MRDSLSMLERLDLETKIHHGPADSARLALLGKPTRERYADYLARIYVFEAPAEARWIRPPGLEATLDVSSRVFAPVLEKDLAMLGRFPDVYETGGFKTIAQALGWMYVVERAVDHVRHHQRMLRDAVERLGELLPAQAERARARHVRAGDRRLERQATREVAMQHRVHQPAALDDVHPAKRLRDRLEAARLVDVGKPAEHREVLLEHRGEHARADIERGLEAGRPDPARLGRGLEHIDAREVVGVALAGRLPEEGDARRGRGSVMYLGLEAEPLVHREGVAHVLRLCNPRARCSPRHRI